MANIINTANASAFKGCFPIGTGVGSGQNFCASLPPPADPVTGAILPGYSLMTNATSATGMEWNFSGAGSSGIKKYKFPATTTPNPFPSPQDAGSDLVLVQREDIVTTGRGLQDLSMPVLGANGLIPEHSLPSLCDPTSGVVFYFDKANAAINVYNITTKTWRIGWLKGVLTQTFSWRAASLLTPDLIDGTNAAPYNVRGLFLSAASTNWKSNNPSVNKGSVPSNFIFVKYTVSGGEINIINTNADITDVTNGATGDWAVSAVCAVNTTSAAYKTPSYAPSVAQIVCAFAVDETSTLTLDASTGLSYGWWGFMGRVSSLPAVLNPNLSIATNFATIFPWCMKTAANGQSGYIQSISVGVGAIAQFQFFLGGNYSRLYFNDVLVERTVVSFPQVSGVAMIFNFSASGAASTIASYQYVGTNGDNINITGRDWRGRVIQSNYAAGYFYFCGSFVAPPSLIGITADAGATSLNNPVTTVPVTTGYSTQIAQAGITQGISRTITVSPELLGGVINEMNFKVPDNAFLPLPISGGSSIFSPGVVFSVTPLEGNLTQASYPLLQIGGSGNVPLTYLQTAFADFQTKLPVVPNAWWYSSIEIYVQTAITVSMRIKLWQTSDSFAATAQFQYRLVDIALAPGLNSLPIYGGGATINAADQLNSNNVSNLPGIIGLSPTSQLMRAQIEFFTTAALTTPVLVSLGANDRNGQQPYPYCWNLNGYDSTAAGQASGYFSGTSAGVALTNLAIGRQLEYSLLNIAVPLTADQLLVQLIPINQNSFRDFFIETAIGTPQGLPVIATIFHDTQGNTQFSGMTLSADSSTVFEVPKLTGGISSQPTFSLFGNSELEVYKVGWANSSDVAFGIYTSFPQFTQLSYVSAPDGSVPSTPADIGEFAFASAQNVTALSVNTIRFNEFDALASLVDWSRARQGDTIIIQKSGARNVYKMTTAITDFGNYYSVGVEITFGSTIFIPADQVSITVLLNIDPESQPIVLKESLGFYWLGNGSAPTTARDIYLSSYGNTGKAYRYVPEYDSTYLLFDTEVLVGGTSVDNTFTADALVFNTNYSSVLLSKSDVDTTKWAVVSTYGSVGYSNLSK
jgi:hypothetical protein